MGDITGLIDFVNRLTPVGFLVVTLFGFWKRWWVPGWMYEEKVNQMAWWRSIATKALNISEQVLPGPVRSSEGGD